MGHPGNWAAMSPLPGQHHPSSLSSQHSGCHIPLSPLILCPYNEGTAEPIPNIPIPNPPSPSSRDPQPSLLPPTGGSRLVVHTIYLLSLGVLQTTGWGGEGWDGEGNSNGFGTSEKLRGTGSALQQSRAGDRGAVGWGRCRAHHPTPLTPQPYPGAWSCSSLPQGLDWAQGQSQPRGRGAKGGSEPQLVAGGLQGSRWDGVGGVGP